MVHHWPVGAGQVWLWRLLWTEPCPDQEEDADQQHEDAEPEIDVDISSFPLDEDDRQNDDDAEGGEAEQLRRLPPAAYLAFVRIARSRIRDTPD